MMMFSVPKITNNTHTHTNKKRNIEMAKVKKGARETTEEKNQIKRKEKKSSELYTKTKMRRMEIPIHYFSMDGGNSEISSNSANFNL